MKLVHYEVAHIPKHSFAIIILSCFLFYQRLTLLSSKTHHRSSLQATHNSDTSTLTPPNAKNISVLGTKAGLGHFSREVSKGLGMFTIEQVPNISLKIPRHHLFFKPNRSNGMVKSLNLLLYWSSLTQGLLDCSETTFALENPEEIVVLLSNQKNYNRCKKMYHHLMWINFFTNYFHLFAWNTVTVPSKKIQNNVTQNTKCLCTYQNISRTLKDEKTYGLISYEKLNSTRNHKKRKPHVLYLNKTTSAAHPTEWITCTAGICKLYWFRDNLVVKVIFSKSLLTQHHNIQKHVNQYIDQIITYSDKKHSGGPQVM